MTPNSMIDSITAKIFFQVMRPGRQQKQTSHMSSRTSKMNEIMSRDCVNCGATGLFSRYVSTLCISLQASEQLLLSLSANLNQLIVPRQTSLKLLLVTVIPRSFAAKKALVLMESTSLKMGVIVPSLPQSLTFSQNQLQLLNALRKYSSFAHLGQQLTVIPTIGVPSSLDIWQYFPLD